MVSAVSVLQAPVRRAYFFDSSVPNFVPSGLLYALSCEIERRAEARIFTSESHCIQICLNH